MATIFHLSDLHIDEKVQPNPKLFTPLLEGHDLETWGKLRTHLKSRIEQTKDYMIVITGDVTACGHKNSYVLAKEFLYSIKDSRIASELGLMINENNYFIIPGNHDAFDGNWYRKNSLAAFNGYFNGQGEFPKILERNIDGLNLIFIGFDSTHRKPVTLSKKLGKGYIEESQYRYAEGYLANKKHDFKIVCLHHNPIFPPNTRKNWNLILENSRKFISWIIKNKIDVVLFGHIHNSFSDVLPLKAMLKCVSKKWSFTSSIRRILYGTNILMEFVPLNINGQKIRYIDSIAYHTISKDNLNVTPISKFNNKKDFEKYLHQLPEYDDFIKFIDAYSDIKTAIIMAGSACQFNMAKENSYLELSLSVSQNGTKNIKVSHHKLSTDNSNPSSMTDFITEDMSLLLWGGYLG